MARKRDGSPQAQVGPKSEKMWRQALMLAVNRLSKDGKTKNINILAQRLVLQAANGDVRALQEIGDRLDGKAAQSVNVRRIGSFEDLSDDELVALARGAER